MSRHTRSRADRMAALATAIALLVVMLASTGAFAGGSDTSGDPCSNCSGCESGECGDDAETPMQSHHHCCTTSCLSHAPVAFTSAQTAPTPVDGGSILPSASVVVAGRATEPPFRPPRD